MMLVAFRVTAIALVVPGTPAEELTAEVGNQDRQFVIERRDLVLEVDRVALVRPEEHLEDVLVPQVHEIVGHRRRELPVGAFHQEVQALRRVEHLESRVVRVRFRLTPAHRRPVDLTPGRVVARARHLEVVGRLHQQARARRGLSTICLGTIGHRCHTHDGEPKEPSGRPEHRCASRHIVYHR